MSRRSIAGVCVTAGIVMLLGGYACTLSGCAASPEFRREIMGIKPADVLNAKKQYLLHAAESPDEIFDRIVANLGRMHTEMRAFDRKERFIVAYRFESVFKACIDTTMVGILVRPAAAGGTEVIIASDNWHLGSFVSAQILEVPKAAPPIAASVTGVMTTTAPAVTGAMTTTQAPAPTAAATPAVEEKSGPVLVTAAGEAGQVASGAIDLVTGVMTTAVAPLTGEPSK